MNGQADAEQSVKQKNGSVELLRFLFTSIIIFFHINLDLWDQKKVVALIGDIPVTFFKHGNIGVEFFFLVTGWLMAKTIYTRYILPGESRQPSCKVPGKGNTAMDGKRTSAMAGKRTSAMAGKRTSAMAGKGGLRAAVEDRNKASGREKDKASGRESLLQETAGFVLHKARAILPYYLLACLLTPLVRLLTDRTLSLTYFLNRLPSLFLLQRIGIGKPFIGCTWYLSSMLLALAVAYPLCRRFYRAFTLFAAPLLCAVLLGAIIVFTGSLGDIEDWFFFTYKTNIRAFAEISMGTTAFEISRRMQGRVHSAALRALLTVTALVCLALSLAYMCSAMDGRAGLAVFYMLFVLVVIAFSGEGLMCRAGIFSHPLFLRLGKISLPMYVTQTLLRMFVPFYFAKSSQWTQCALIYFGIIAFAVFLQTISACLHRRPAFRARHRRRAHGI